MLCEFDSIHPPRFTVPWRCFSPGTIFHFKSCLCNFRCNL